MSCHTSNDVLSQNIVAQVPKSIKIDIDIRLLTSHAGLRPAQLDINLKRGAGSEYNNQNSIQ